jgi:hypothetical protein
VLMHGTLHAQGYEHQTNERDAPEMEALEVLLIGGRLTTLIRTTEVGLRQCKARVFYQR